MKDIRSLVDVQEEVKKKNVGVRGNLMRQDQNDATDSCKYTGRDQSTSMIP